mmetsp:Transcript_10548/g.1589  ORF Transcript_10548/g.1589 Transcript_10548/m.1589 type:complete len:88 (-) Transcript_10548:478-741(-)
MRGNRTHTSIMSFNYIYIHPALLYWNAFLLYNRRFFLSFPDKPGLSQSSSYIIFQFLRLLRLFLLFSILQLLPFSQFSSILKRSVVI